MIVNTPKTLDDYAFRSDDEDDEDEGERQATQVEFVEDSSDDDSSDEEAAQDQVEVPSKLKSCAEATNNADEALVSLDVEF